MLLIERSGARFPFFIGETLVVGSQKRKKDRQKTTPPPGRDTPAQRALCHHLNQTHDFISFHTSHCFEATPAGDCGDDAQVTHTKRGLNEKNE